MLIRYVDHIDFILVIIKDNDKNPISVTILFTLEQYIEHLSKNIIEFENYYNI